MFTTHNDNWGGLSDADNKFYDEKFGQYVPAWGKSSNLGGEILRAISRIVYKFYNDGDTVSRYYSSSYNHSYGAEKFLKKHVPDYEPMRDIDYDDTLEFEEAVCKNLKRVVDYLRKNPDLFEVNNYQGFLDLSPKEEWPDEDDWDDEDCA